MQGIQSLMPQGPVPGQAPQQPMQGMMPKPGASTPPAQVKFLETKPSRELKAMYDQRPSLALLGAYEKAVKREELEASMRGQQAMQQAAGAPATIADSIMQQPVMAAHGGEMHSYAGGGAVSFTGGGNPEIERILKKGPYERTIEENEILRAAGVEVTRRTVPEGGVSEFNRFLESPFFRRMFTGEAYKLSPEELAKRNDAGATTERIFRGLGGNQFVEPTAISTPAGGTAGTRQGKSGIADLDIGPSMAPVQRTGVAAATTQKLGAGQPQQRPQTVPGKEVGAAELAAMQQGISNQASGIRTLSEPSDEERFARQQARQADIARLEEEKKVAREFREGASKQYADVERQVNLPFLESNAQIALLGAGLTGRRGETASGLLKGIGAIEANKQARLDAARKEMREDQRTAMQMDSVNRQLSVAQQEKAYADMRGDREGSLAAAEKIAALTNAQNKLAYDYRIKQEEIGIERIKADAARSSAAKPTTQEALRSWFESDPKGFSAFIEAQNEPKSAAAMRKSLMEQWGKNLMLQQKFPNFEDFVTTMTPPTGGAGAGGGEFKVLSSRPKT